MNLEHTYYVDDLYVAACEGARVSPRLASAPDEPTRVLVTVVGGGNESTDAAPALPIRVWEDLARAALTATFEAPDTETFRAAMHLARCTAALVNDLHQQDL